MPHSRKSGVPDRDDILVVYAVLRCSNVRTQSQEILCYLHADAAGAMREVITLQTGSFANYVGAHYLNIQASISDTITSRTARHSAYPGRVHKVA